ncbi:MAG TPA: cation transporter [Bacteroidales bacterium]|nr:cation transporter [Bacteroidales bacterium]
MSGYSSGLILLIFAIVILAEAIQRLLAPSEILYQEAIIVAVIGLAVNITSAFILHHKKEFSENNIRATYLHVMLTHSQVSQQLPVFQQHISGISGGLIL